MATTCDQPELGTLCSLAMDAEFYMLKFSILDPNAAYAAEQPMLSLDGFELVNAGGRQPHWIGPTIKPEEEFGTSHRKLYHFKLCLRIHDVDVLNCRKAQTG